MHWSRSIRFFVARLLTALFAVQIVAAGFCLLVPQAHAMAQMDVVPISQLGAEALCAKKDVQKANSHMHEADGCFHCEKPDLATTVSVESPLLAQSALLLFVVASVVADEIAVDVAPLGSLHDPGGSAGDRALLFHLIPRIRV